LKQSPDTQTSPSGKVGSSKKGKGPIGLATSQTLKTRQKDLRRVTREQYHSPGRGRGDTSGYPDRKS